MTDDMYLDHNMGFFIEIEDGKPLRHPIAGRNLSMFFPNFDPNNPPPPFEKFIRKRPPRVGPLEVLQETTYEKIDGVWQDVFHVASLPSDVRNQKIADYLKEFKQPHDSWTFNEEELRWKAPVDYPEDGGQYVWDEDRTNWVLQEEYTRRQRELYSAPGKRFIGSLATVAELPTNYQGQEGDGYLIAENNQIYEWDGTKWAVFTGIFDRLSSRVIIDARLDNTQVKILGVFDELNKLPTSYSGDIADGYIIDNINRIYAWNGSKWVEAEIIDNKM